MPAHIWGTSDDGLFEFASVTSDTLEGGMNVMRQSFFMDEKVCIAIELPQNPEAVAELEELSHRPVTDGVSLVAIEKATGTVVGIAFNKLQVKGDNQDKYFEEYAANCRYPSAKALVQFMIDADGIVDLFDISQASCLLELMFVATLPSFRGKGIARKLFEYSIELGKTLLSGKNVKVGLDGQTLPIEPVPTVVSAIFTSTVTQYLGKNLGFIRAAEISYEKFIFEGKSFANRIGSDPPNTTVEYLPL